MTGVDRHGLERTRLENQRLGKENWRLWGPYLSERAWGTVREDYSPDGEAWDYLSARSGALAGLSLERRRSRRRQRRSSSSCALRWRCGTAAIPS